MKGDIRKATLNILKREIPKVYRAHVGGGDFADLAIILMPQQAGLRAATSNNTIRLVIDSEGRGIPEYSVRFTR